MILVAGLVYTVIKRPAGLDVTFSQRVANNKQSEILYSVLFVLTLPLLFLFFMKWFVPANNLPKAFLWFAAISIIFQIMCTWIPERGGHMTTIHRLLTGMSGVALLPMVILIANAHSISPVIRYIVWAGLFFMAVLLLIALAKQRGFRYALLLQVGYYALFLAIIMLVTYL